MSPIDDIHAQNPYTYLLADAPADGIWWSHEERVIRAAVDRWTNYALDAQRTWDALQIGSSVRFALADLYSGRDHAAIHDRHEEALEFQWRIIVMRYKERLMLRREHDRAWARLRAHEAEIERLLAGEVTDAVVGDGRLL